ncbi:hypothetical protein MMC13_003399 [Lambiella insularis]|nr:hypothetical protein [Lambiella insularis]
MTQLAPVGGGFRPGTKILTPGNSPIFIEDIFEGLEVVTYRGNGHEQIGVCSDEIITTPTRCGALSVDLWGFNDELPFFSANTVFNTPDGYCAIDPEAAMRANRWLRVLKLEAGRSVYFFNNQSYREVRIERVTNARANCQTLHGVHLREGLRSYHANGYLIQDNYPEITAHSIEHALQMLPRQEQRNLLDHIDAMIPLLAMVGADTRRIVSTLEQQAFPWAHNEQGSAVGSHGQAMVPSTSQVGSTTTNPLPRSRHNGIGLRMGRYMVRAERMRHETTLQVIGQGEHTGETWLGNYLVSGSGKRRLAQRRKLKKKIRARGAENTSDPQTTLPKRKSNRGRNGPRQGARRRQRKATVTNEVTIKTE